ncbi:hypothetical protein [Williamsia sterculiae]|uniref:ATP/GTP-binding protein n=1 Tax=Williamsia sterculiae TaxID=1344003 RepID=A0A1N7HFK0_9NOCA|nr:hypothetical protein [Williamsia sterculiae]SIS23657.1 hypothetical protein SAMN05445060_4141 [Williamsia sterculiae]
MPRHNRRDRQRPPPAGGGFGFSQVEPGPSGLDVDHHVRRIPASRATKIYRCPGCNNTITVGTAHIVAWPVDDFGGAEERRHWHTGCWTGRRGRTGYR